MPFARLREIEAAFRAQTAPGELVRIGGTIASIAPGVCRVRGLSGAVKLGDVVSFRGHGGHQRGEVIALNDSEVTVAPYSHALQLSLGGAVFAEAPRTPSAHGDYLGRVVNAFGEPLDDRGPVALRELQKIQHRFESTVVFAETSALNKAQNMAFYEHLDRAELMNEEVDIYLGVTPEDMHRSAIDLFQPDNSGTLIYVPAR